MSTTDKAPSTALTKRSGSSMSLMPPPPAPKRIKRPSIVLDEDTYTSAISHIIRRDFFPGLAEVDVQREYLNAVESGNKAWIREAGRKLTEVMTPGPGPKRRKVAGDTGGRTPHGRTPGLGRGETPSTWGADTPVTLAGTEAEEEDNEEEEAKPKVDLNLRLDDFSAKYTSEDQESFSRIIDRQNEKRFHKNEWLRTGNMHPSKQRLAQQKALEASASNQKESTSTEIALRPSQDLDDRRAAPTYHKHTPFNTLMFPPESIESWAPTRAQQSQSASLAPPKAVLPHNTRLPPTTTDIPDRPPSPTMSAVRDAISGNPRLSQSEIGYSGSSTPRVNGYAFVDATGPSSDEEDAPTDLLEKYGAGKSDPSPFTIKESERREKLHMKMVDRINIKKSGKERESKVNTPLAVLAGNTPRFLSAPTPRAGAAANPGMTPGRKNVGSLTPAAQRLFEKVGGRTPGPREVRGGFGGKGQGSGSSGLGREWTPTPRVKRKT